MEAADEGGGTDAALVAACMLDEFCARATAVLKRLMAASVQVYALASSHTHTRARARAYSGVPGKLQLLVSLRSAALSRYAAM